MLAKAENRASNKGILSLLKNTFLMGGTQIVHILLTLLKGKIVAMFVGLAGTGLSSIYWTATSWVQQLASIGLPLAAVKDIAKEKDEEKRNFLISLVKRFFFIAAIVGTGLALILSPLLSVVSFSDYSHTPDFMCLSIMVWFAVMGAGEVTILQGLNQVKPLYRATLIGSISGVLLGLPFYWFLGLKGIVWALIIASAATFFALKFMVSKVMTIPMANTRQLLGNKPVISGTIKSGLILFIGGLIGTISNFILLSVIRAWGGIDDVGSYQSALNIISQIGAVVFAAMTVDYFPKLAASDSASMNRLVDNQIFIGVGLTVPIMCFLMVLSPWAVRLLLSDEFLVVVPTLRWFALAMVIKAVSYPLGFIALAKARRRLYFRMEVIGLNAVYIVGMLLGFYLHGLTGLGMALCIIYAVDIIIYLSVCCTLFEVRLGRNLLLFITGAILYTGLMLHLTITDFILLYPYVTFMVAFGSLLFPAAIYLKTRKRLPHREDAL